MNTKNLKIAFQSLSDTRILTLLAFAVVAILVTFSGISVVQKNYELDKQISAARQRNDVEKLENQNLKLKNTYYQTNQFLELAARRQFGKASAGERLYIVPEEVALAKTVDMPKPAVVTAAPQKSSSKQRQNLDAWLDFLFY